MLNLLILYLITRDLKKSIYIINKKFINIKPSYYGNSLTYFIVQLNENNKFYNLLTVNDKTLLHNEIIKHLNNYKGVSLYTRTKSLKTILTFINKISKDIKIDNKYKTKRNYYIFNGTDPNELVLNDLLINLTFKNDGYALEHLEDKILPFIEIFYNNIKSNENIIFLYHNQNDIKNYINTLNEWIEIIYSSFDKENFDKLSNRIKEIQLWIQQNVII